MPHDADRIVDLYHRHADVWDRERPRRLMEKAWLDRFMALLRPSGSVLDIGCGCAEPIARYFVEAGYRVTGVDSSARMIGMCGVRFRDHDWRVADMRTLRLGRAFDGVLAWNSFFHLAPDDQRRMFPVFRAHAAPDAALMFTSGPRAGEAVGTFHGEPLYHASLDEAEYRSLLDANGFAVVSYVAEDPQCGRHTIWLARRT
jgi:SAM-dependent methyltransferase